MRELSEDEFRDWKEHPLTRVFLHWVADNIKGLEKSWGRGNFTGPDAFETVQLNSKALGKCEAYERVLEWDHADALTFINESQE